MRFVLGPILAIVCMLSSPAAAVTVDFSSFPAGNQSRYLAFEGGLVVATGDGSVIVYGPDDALSGICSGTADQVCDGGELVVIFFGRVNVLSFKLNQPDVPQAVTVSAIGEGQQSVEVISTASGAQAIPPVGTETRQLKFALAAATNGGAARLQSIGFSPVPLIDSDTAGEAEGSSDAADKRSILDFSTAIALEAEPSTLLIGDAQVTHIGGGDFFVYEPLEFGMPETGGFCALEAGFVCLGDILVTFGTLIQDLTFEAFFGKTGDSATANIYAGQTLLGSRQIAGEGVVDFLGYAGITHLEIIDKSNPSTKGFAYGNFEYAIYTPIAPVPVPASLPALLGGLGALAAFAWRRNARIPT